MWRDFSLAIIPYFSFFFVFKKYWLCTEKLNSQVNMIVSLKTEQPCLRFEHHIWNVVYKCWWLRFRDFNDGNISCIKERVNSTWIWIWLYIKETWVTVCWGFTAISISEYYVSLPELINLTWSRWIFFLIVNADC